MSWPCSASAIHGAASNAWPYCLTAPNTGPPPNGRRADRRCVSILALKIRTTLSPISNEDFRLWPRPRVGAPRKLSGCGCRTSAAQDKLQIAQVNEDTKSLPYDEHGVLTIERIAEQHQTAADRENPERRRHDTLAGAFRRNPLHDETHGEHCLRDIADQNSPIRCTDEHVVQIPTHRLCDIDQHLYGPLNAHEFFRKTGLNFRDRALVLNLRNSFFAADKPPHAGQIQDPYPQSVPHPVV